MLNDTRRQFFRWLSGLCVLPMFGKAIASPAKEHDGCFQASLTLNLGTDAREANRVAELLSIENEMLVGGRIYVWDGKQVVSTFLHEVRASDGSIATQSAVVFVKRLRIDNFLKEISEEPRAALKAILEASENGRAWRTFLYNPYLGSIPSWVSAHWPDFANPTINTVWAISIPYPKDDAALGLLVANNALKTIGARHVFQISNSDGSISPKHECFYQRERSIGVVVADMTLEDRRAMLTALRS